MEDIYGGEDFVKVIALRPRFDKSIIKKLVADFTPSPERSKVTVDNLEEPRPDNPRDLFDNRPSNIPWDNTGKFNSPQEMADLVNSTTLDDPAIMKALGVPVAIATLGLYLAKKRKGIQEGTFREVKKGVHTEVRLPGYYTLWSMKSNWGDVHQIDDEENNMVTVGVKAIVRVRANNLGTAYLVGDKFDEDGNVIGHDGDLVLFSQGSYVLDESKYRDINTGPIEENEPIIKIGDATILNIGPEAVGGALHRGTQKYRVFQRGAPIIFDNKEWCDYAVVRRRKKNFQLGPLQFLTLSSNEVACIGAKDGTHLFLDQEDTFMFHTRDWETFDKHTNEENFDVGAYYVRTVGHDQAAVVREMATGDYHPMRPGKYVLNRRDYSNPLIVDLNSPVVECGPWTFLRVQEDHYTGARNALTGKFQEFDNVGSLIKLHKKDYPNIDRVKKVSLQAKAFGPFKIITIPNGMLGVFEELGKIRIANPGTYKLEPGCLILDPLPNCPQEFNPTVEFLARDGFGLRVGAIVHYVLDDPIKITTKLRSSLSSFAEMCKSLEGRADKSLVKLLRACTLEELIGPDGEAKALEISEECEADLNRYSEQAGVGVTFKRIQLTGGFILTDSEVRANMSQLAKSDLMARSADAQAKANKAEAQALAVKQVEQAEMLKRVKLLQQETQMKSEEMKLAIDKMKSEQRLNIKVAEQKAKSEMQEMRLEVEKEGEAARADSSAYSVERVAEAQHRRALQQNEAGKARPSAIARVEEMKQLVAAMSAIGTADWTHPEPVYDLLHRLGDAGGAGPFVTANILAQLQKGS